MKVHQLQQLAQNKCAKQNPSVLHESLQECTVTQVTDGMQVASIDPSPCDLWEANTSHESADVQQSTPDLQTENVYS